MISETIPQIAKLLLHYDPKIAVSRFEQHRLADFGSLFDPSSTWRFSESLGILRVHLIRSSIVWPFCSCLQDQITPRTNSSYCERCACVRLHLRLKPLSYLSTDLQPRITRTERHLEYIEFSHYVFHPKMFNLIGDIKDALKWLHDCVMFKWYFLQQDWIIHIEWLSF